MVEQLVTLQTLYNLNTPAAEIAGVVERMRVSERQTPGPSMSNGPDSELTGDAPPGYESILPGGL